MSKIMIVEDDNNLRAIYGDRLIAEGHEVVSASDGEEALAIAVKQKPDLIISDVMMPKISGFDMLDILRSTPETKDTKVIMMTALSQAEDKERADRLGADKYLVKSQVTLDDVARVVNEVIASNDTTPTATPAATPVVMPAPTPMPVAPAPSLAATPAIATPAATPMPEPAPVSAAPVAAPLADTPQADSTSVTTPAPATDAAAPVAATAAADEAATDAEAVDEEKAEISAQIENFMATNVPGDSGAASAPAADPSAQDHAMSAVTPSAAPVVPAEPAPVSAAEPEAPAESPDAASANTSKKVIEPLPDSGNKPNIYDLYEKEMASEAARASTPSAPGTAGPVVDAPAPDAPATPPATTPATPPAQGDVPHPNDPSSIAL